MIPPQVGLRIGFGFDTHRLVSDRKLMVGGVEVPFDKGFEGHSDADVLLHAVCDALLGAAALGDIGRHFPNTDPRYRGIASILLLKHVAELLSQHRYAAVNIDATVALDEPKIAPYVEQMCENISSLLNIPMQNVSVKATTQEGLSFVGKGEGGAAYAVALIIQQ
jgi:2-C-methyl-D-erythritol 2,4-cyclodiphosphate synthase